MNKKHIGIIEPDIELLNDLTRILRQPDWETYSFRSAEAGLQELLTEPYDLLIVDIHLPDRNSLEVVETAQRIKPLLPVIMIAGDGDISLVIRALRAGAEGIIEKPLNAKTLLPLIQSLLAKHNRLDPLEGMALTETENKVLRLVVGGKTTLEIAQILQRSPSTIEDHRSHIMRKLKVKNVAELVRTILQGQSARAETPEKLWESLKS